MKKGTELKQHFHTCMPLFIALGDEIRLTIIEALTDEALTGRKKNNPMNTNQPDKNDDRPISLPNQPRPHGLNVREITERRYHPFLYECIRQQHSFQGMHPVCKYHRDPGGRDFCWR